MFKFSKTSQDNRDTCHPDLIKLMDASIKSSPIDFSIICGHRGAEAQNEANENGFSDLRYPLSKHNMIPSDGIDIQPYPYTQEDKNDLNHAKFKILSKHIKSVAKKLDIDVINGGLDWGKDWFHWERVK